MKNRAGIRSRRFAWLFVLALLLLPGTLFAQEGNLGFISTETATILDSTYQLRISAAYYSDFASLNDGRSGSFTQLGRAHYLFAVADRVELGISYTLFNDFNGDNDISTSGGGDIRLSTKIKIFEKGAFTFSGRALVKLPNASEDKDYASNQTDTELLLLATFGNDYKLHIFAGVEIQDDNDRSDLQNDMFTWGLGGEFPINDRWTVGVEAKGRRDTYLDENELTFGAGVQFNMARWALDFSVIHYSSFHEADGFGGRVGLIYRFGKSD